MSRTRAVDMGNRRELMDLLEHLQKQGARIQWSGGGGGKHKSRRASGFPAKVIPPDPDKPIITFHETASSRASSTLYRNLVRRSGLTWPGEDADTKRSRKETQKMTETTERTRGEHLMVPAAVRARTAPPLQTAIDRVKPYVAGLPEQFWTDQLVDRMRDNDEPGFRSKSGASGRAQDLLDMLGYRVIETKPNRNGFSYRWQLEAEPQPGSVKSALPPGGRPRAQEEVEREVSATPGMVERETTPVGFQVFERPQRTKQHDRVMCADCQRHFTPDGLERHQDETGHGLLPNLKATAEAAFTPDPDDSLPGLDDAPAQVDKPVDEVHTDEEAALALAEEAQSEAAELRRQLTDANEEIARRDERAREFQRQIRDLAAEASRLGQEATDEREARERAEQALLAMHAEREDALEKGEGAPMAAPAPVDDGSWPLSLDDVKDSYVSMLVAQAQRLGVVLELRARRA